MSEGQAAALLLWVLLLTFSLRGTCCAPLSQSALSASLPRRRHRAGAALDPAGRPARGTGRTFGLTSLTLLLGWRLALLAPCLTLLVLSYFGVIPLAEIGWQALIGVALPVATTWLMFLASWAWLPRHLFVYLFVVAFLGALSISIKVVASALLMGLSNTYPWYTISADYLSIWPLLLFPEALLNGMTMTLLAIYRPHWVNTFFDREYLGR